MIDENTLFKVLGENGQSYHGGTGNWNLPVDDQPGEWMPPIEGDLIPCENGYHLCRPNDLVGWLGPTLWIAEAGEERVEDSNKIVVREARLIAKADTWNERTARLFACDCADRALALLNPDDIDPRSIEAVRVARLYAIGEASGEELDAAWDAAGAAGAAGAAARAAARAAAWDAAGDARDAAWDAAWAAAWDAARAAAWDVAWAAAWDAAWDAWAAGAAARAAERKWQTDRLMQYLKGEL